MRSRGDKALTNHSPPTPRWGGRRRRCAFRCQFQLIVSEAVWLLFLYPVVSFIDWYQFIELHYGWMSPNECKFQAMESRYGVWWKFRRKMEKGTKPWHLSPKMGHSCTGGWESWWSEPWVGKANEASSSHLWRHQRTHEGLQSHSRAVLLICLQYWSHHVKKKKNQWFLVRQNSEK